MVGKIYKGKSQSVHFKVISPEDILKIIKHFDKFPLFTKKQTDYVLFKKAFNIILNKQHLTPEGLDKLVALKASLNRGLSCELQDAFFKVTPVDRPLIQNLVIPNPE